MTLQDEIDGLPEWPEYPPVVGVAGGRLENRVWREYSLAKRDAALARLALARKVLRQWKDERAWDARDGSHWLRLFADDIEAMDALLKALEEPR